MFASRVLVLLLVLGWLLPVAAAQPEPADVAPETASLNLVLGEGPVFIVPIEGTIDLVLSRYVDRAIADAEAAGASAIVFHIDTFGGLVDAADRIRTSILHTDVPTVAFIDPNAASAGALISFAADRIVMAPGASMGAATAVDGTGDYASEKIQSYMRGLMRSTAESTGRDPRIAEAMVDERIDVPGISEAGTLLTLSAGEAASLGVADLVLRTKSEVYAAMGVTNQEVVEHHSTTAERVLRLLGSPIVASLLMVVMLGGFYTEIRTPGLGVAGLLASFAAAMFFAPHYLLGLVHGWEVFVFFLGILLILAEIFVIPGFGIPGVLGAIMVVFSLGISRIGNIGFQFPTGGEITQAILTLASALVMLVIFMFLIGSYLPKNRQLNKLVLSPELDSALGWTSATTFDELVGQQGVAITPLRPAGTAQIGSDRIDVVTEGSFIDRGSPVEVTSVSGSRVVVRPVRS